MTPFDRQLGPASSRRLVAALAAFFLLVFGASLTQGKPTTAAQKSAGPYAGAYVGKVWKGRLALVIDAVPYPKLKADLVPSKMKSKCGPVSFDEIAVDKIKDNRVSFHDVQTSDSGLKETYTLKGEFTGDGWSFKGTFRHTARDKASGDRCDARTHYTAKLKEPDVLTPRDAGHYVGRTASPDDQPISFDIAYDPASKGGTITNLAWNVGPMNCIDPDTLEEVVILGHHSVSGPFPARGRFTFRFPTPDAGIETNLAIGDVLRKKATGTLYFTEYFDADGTPNPHGRFLCSSLGTGWEAEAPTFEATLQG